MAATTTTNFQCPSGREAERRDLDIGLSIVSTTGDDGSKISAVKWNESHYLVQKSKVIWEDQKSLGKDSDKNFWIVKEMDACNKTIPFLLGGLPVIDKAHNKDGSYSLSEYAALMTTQSQVPDLGVFCLTPHEADDHVSAKRMMSAFWTTRPTGSEPMDLSALGSLHEQQPTSIWSIPDQFPWIRDVELDAAIVQLPSTVLTFGAGPTDPDLVALVNLLLPGAKDTRVTTDGQEGTEEATKVSEAPEEKTIA